MAKKLVLLETMAFNTSDDNVYTYRSSDGWKQYVNQGNPGDGSGSSSSGGDNSILELDSAGAVTTKNGTKNIVPNNNMEGNLGTSSKKWAKVFAGEIVSAKVITNELTADKISGKIASETVSKVEQTGTDLIVTYADGKTDTFTVSGSVDLTDYIKAADADTKFALINHNHDLSAYALKDDVKDLLNKTDADNSYAPLTHDHNDAYYTKVEVNTNIAVAIAAAELNDKDVDLSAYLTVVDADATYLKKTDAIDSDTVQNMIDGAGHLTNADIAGLLDKDTADTLYQPVGTYLDKDTADTLYQPIGASSGGIDVNTVQSMIDNAGHLTAADVATMQADIDAAKADASAAKTAAEQAAQDAQDAKTKAESVETIANDAKTKAEAADAKADTAKTTAETAQATADAAKTAADNAQTTADNINTYLASDEFKTLLEKQMQELFASSIEDPDNTEEGGGSSSGSGGESGTGPSEGESGGSSSSGSGETGGSTGSLTPGTKTTFAVQEQNNGSIDLSTLNVRFTEDQILNEKVHFYVMPDSTAIGSYIQTNYPEGLEIPISFDGETDETIAYDKIWSDNSLENPGYIVSFNASDGDDSSGFDVLEMSSYTISAGWTLGILIDA